jgi:hypothetical protein
MFKPVLVEHEPLAQKARAARRAIDAQEVARRHHRPRFGRAQRRIGYTLVETGLRLITRGERAA